MKESTLRALLRLLAENTVRTGNPLGAPKSVCEEWRRGIAGGGGGEYVFFTGCLYQLAPYIIALRRVLPSLLSKPGLLGLASRLGGLAQAFSRALARPDRKLVERFNAIPRRVFNMLRRSGVGLRLPPSEEYSGVLLYDLGLDGFFAEHARRVYGVLRSAGSKVVTIDPHTFYVLRDVYPKFVDGYDLDVYHYTQLLKGAEGAFKSAVDGPVAVHDSCYLARHTGIIEHVRRAQALVGGVEYRYPKMSGRMTGCCGGPVEVLFPRLAERIAESRVEELAETGGRAIVAFCPICIVNLAGPAGARGLPVLDFSEVVEVAGDGG